MIPKDLRLRGLAAACALMAAAACGGGDDDAAKAAAPAASADSAAAPAAAARDSAAPTPGAQVDTTLLDSAMTPAEAAEVAKAPVQGPVNVQVLDDYELTIPRVRQLLNGARNLVLLQQRRPELQQTMRIPTIDPNLLYQRVNSIPEAREAVAQAGLTPREYATGTAALLQAMLVWERTRQGGNLPEGVRYNEKNVDFVAEHIQEILTMSREAGAQLPQQGQQPGS